MNMRMIVIILAIVSATACAAFPAKRSPQLSRPRVAPTVAGEPSIRLVVRDRTEFPEKTKRSLERARRTFPYLAQSHDVDGDGDYTIDLSVDYTETEYDLNDFAGYSMLIFPWRLKQEVCVEASVRDSEDRLIGVFDSTGRSTQVAQLHLLWVLPITAPLSVHVERKMWSNTFRDALIQASEAIAQDQRSGGDFATSPTGQ